MNATATAPTTIVLRRDNIKRIARFITSGAVHTINGHKVTGLASIIGTRLAVSLEGVKNPGILDFGSTFEITYKLD